jgi:Protein of unknown function (DUF3551)
MRASFVALGILAAAIVSSAPAGAQNYPWCAQYSGGSMGGGRNCGFTTFEQCLATVHGIGGTCSQNTQYEPPPGVHQKPRRKSFSNY